MGDLHQLAVVVCLLLALTDGNPTGPPVSTTDVCKDMFPSGHNAQAQTGNDAVNVTLGKDCYEAGEIILGQFS